MRILFLLSFLVGVMALTGCNRSSAPPPPSAEEVKSAREKALNDPNIPQQAKEDLKRLPEVQAVPKT